MPAIRGAVLPTHTIDITRTVERLSAGYGDRIVRARVSAVEQTEGGHGYRVTAGDREIEAQRFERPIMLYRNETDVGTARFIEVKVSARQGGSRGGVGGRVAIRAGELIQFRDISGGSSRASQSELSARFGLGQWTGVEWVAVLWSDGEVMTATHVEGNRTLTLPSR